MTTISTCTPRQAKSFIIEIIEAGLVPFVQSSPGIGKSSIFKEVASYFNLHLIDHRLSTSAPEDMSGLPRFNSKGHAEFAPFSDLFPTEDMPIPKGKDGFLIFLDEFNSASKAVQAASYKLILDRMTGQHKLHPNSVIGAAGNLMSDRAIVNPLSTAMQSRVISLEMRVDFEEWLEDIALPQKYDSRIVAYLSQYPSKLMDFRPDHENKTFCSPRTWEFMNKLIKDKQITQDKIHMYSGTITSGVAVDFLQFTKVFDSLVTIKDICNGPLTCKIPSDTSSQWATITHMLENVTTENFEHLAKYVSRFPFTFRVLFFRAIKAQQPQLTNSETFANGLIEINKYLKGK